MNFHDFPPTVFKYLGHCVWKFTAYVYLWMCWGMANMWLNYLQQLVTKMQ